MVGETNLNAKAARSRANARKRDTETKDALSVISNCLVIAARQPTRTNPCDLISPKVRITSHHVRHVYHHVSSCEY